MQCCDLADPLCEVLNNSLTTHNQPLEPPYSKKHFSSSGLSEVSGGG
jgi:hypothetical protein